MSPPGPDVGGAASKSPLEGIRVLELGHYITVPFCTQVLADQGADVIKVEPPTGDSSRGREAYSYDDLYFHALNRNKRSVMLDLKQPPERDRLAGLIRTADVVVTNYAVGVPERLGFGYEQVRAINPNVVYVQSTGFGIDSPYARRPAFDGIIQAMSGMMHLTGEPDGQPMLAGVFVADHVAGLYAALAVMFGLARRQRTGTGNFTDLAMLDTMASFLGPAIGEVLQLGERPRRVGSRVRRSYAGTYPGSDGDVYLAPLPHRMWANLAALIERPELLDDFPDPAAPDTRLENRDRLDGLISQWTSARTVAEIEEAMRQIGVPCSPIYSVERLTEDEHISHRRVIRGIPHLGGGDGRVYVPGSPLPVAESSYDRAPPTIGQHNAELLDAVPGGPAAGGTEDPR
ncbi:MAG: CoA transferase [Thermoleophilia bacterium]|nr:CoA transferase [Thermoleophilia bacterium]